MMRSRARSAKAEAGFPAENAAKGKSNAAVRPGAMGTRAASLMILSGLVLAPVSALARDLPEIRVSPSNAVPACATPGRLWAFLESRNKRLDPRYGAIAANYMRHGEALGLRWDIAFFQMMVETGNLAYTGDVKPAQNNFAGLGASGGGAPGETFPDISTGVLAHLQHVLLYAGGNIENPVAERTRKVQEWKVIEKWYKDVKGPRTYAHLAKRWALGSSGYPRDIAAIADAFMKGPCKEADPQPDLLAAAQGDKPNAKPPRAASGEPPSRLDDEPSPPLDTAAVAPEPPADREPSREAKAAPEFAGPGEKPKPPVTILNEQKLPAATDRAAPGGAGADPRAEAGADAGGKAVAMAPAVPPAGAASCRVWTASYGGSKAIIIRATLDKTVNYTVLDVNEGKEKSEAQAYIAAYAKGGETVGEFASQTQALDKAFELCPEG